MKLGRCVVGTKAKVEVEDWSVIDTDYSVIT